MYKVIYGDNIQNHSIETNSLIEAREIIDEFKQTLPHTKQLSIYGELENHVIIQSSEYLYYRIAVIEYNEIVEERMIPIWAI